MRQDVRELGFLLLGDKVLFLGLVRRVKSSKELLGFVLRQPLATVSGNDFVFLDYYFPVKRALRSFAISDCVGKAPLRVADSRIDMSLL